jgi:hypothetical protein
MRAPAVTGQGTAWRRCPSRPIPDPPSPPTLGALTNGRRVSAALSSAERAARLRSAGQGERHESWAGQPATTNSKLRARRIRPRQAQADWRKNQGHLQVGPTTGRPPVTPVRAVQLPRMLRQVAVALVDTKARTARFASRLHSPAGPRRLETTQPNLGVGLFKRGPSCYPVDLA